MDNSLLTQILHEYELKRNKSIKDAEKRKRELLEVNPRLAEIESELSSNSIQASKAILMSNSQKQATLLADLEKKNNSLIKEKNAFLKNLSKENDYLNPHFECQLCKDTGYIQKNNTTVMCTCLKQRIFDIAYNKSNIGNLERENFSNFNIKIFSDIPDIVKYKSELSPKENMKKIKEAVLAFVENFDDPYEKNLIFMGSTGVGKTYLTNCIANEILKSGKTVLYQTAPVMFEEIINAKFERENNKFNLYKNILNADLLIIDDLGTEFITESKITELFTILNTRLLNKNHKTTKTIISTNLNVRELELCYDPRIMSRLAGSYKFYRIFGEDLRYKKAHIK